MATKRKSAKVADKMWKKADTWLLTSIRILQILSDTKAYDNWLISSGNIEKKEQFFRGYRLVSGLVFGVMIEQLSSDYLDFENDFRMYRVKFVGADPENIPSYSDSIITLKKLTRQYKKIFSNETWADLGENLRIIQPFVKELIGKIKRNNFDKSVNEREILWDMIAFDRIKNFFDVDDEGNSHFWIHTINARIKKSDCTIGTFPGYISSLEYIVSSLNLDPNIKSRFTDVPRKIEKYMKKSLESFQEQRNFFWNYNQNYDDDIVSWIAFHFFFSNEWEEYCRSTEDRSGNIQTLPSFLARSDILTSAHFLEGLDYNEPQFFQMRDHQSIKKILDYHLFWYDFSLVDSCGYGTFNGVPAFISILYGYCKLKGKTAAQPVLVRVFKHPEPGMENAFRYSFAVLVEMYGTFSDASGWLIFNDCATDFSGTGGALHDQAMEWINKMETEGLCKSEAIEIDSEMFDWYIKEYRFERRMAIHDARTEIDSRDGISTSIFENFISERESSNSLMKNSRSVNVLESERQQIAEEIVLNVGHVNLIISRISKDDFKFIVLDPMLSLRFAIPCEDEKDFSNRIGYLSRSFTSECEPMRRLLEKSESDWKSIRLLEEWNRSKNGGKIPQTVIELWQKIMRVRNNMPSYHDQKTEYIELVEFFKIKFPIDYAKFWDEIMIRFSDSLLDFMKSMN